jgi:DNA-directed RNA polymerase II subunit RPB11
MLMNLAGMPNTCIFHFNKEDHTLGNLLRSKLLANSHVLFSGYKVGQQNPHSLNCLLLTLVQVPHPLFPKFELRVQTDGEITPKQAVLGSCKELVKELAGFKTEFAKEYELRKMVSGAPNGQ